MQTSSRLRLDWIGVGALACVALILPAPAAQAAWPTYQYDASHSGYVPISLDTAAFVLRWQHSVGDSKPLNPVAVGDGRVFVTNVSYFGQAGLFALDAETGQQVWQVFYNDLFSVNPPAYDAGKVYVQTGNHSNNTYLRSYRGDTGALVFQAAHSAQWERYYAPTIVNGTVYIDGGYYGGMYAFDGTDGTRRWFNGSMPQYDEWTPAVDDEYAYAYLGEYRPGLYIVNRATGASVGIIDDPNFAWNGWSMDLAPVLGGSGDVIAIHNGRLIRFDVPGRRIAWEKERSFSGQPSVAHGVIYAIDAGALTAWDQATGTLLWSWSSPNEKLIGPLIVTDTHVLAPGERNTYAIDLQTHLSTWSYARTGQLALADGSLYVAGSDGTLTAFNAVPPPDRDADRVPDRFDNCPDVPNADQDDRDRDGVGDACNSSIDVDGDEFADGLDNCPGIANPSQINSDRDQYGDPCDPFPTEANNEFAQCRLEKEVITAELVEASIALEQCLAPPDADADGVPDARDLCAQTAPTAPVDALGCSKPQFCARFKLKVPYGGPRCAFADWTGSPGSGLDCAIEQSVCVAR